MEYEVTGDEFHEILKRFIEEKVSVDELLSMADIYEILSEKYNNEVLEIWEQEKDRIDQEKEELFAFVLQEQNGEHEYMHDRLVKARDIKEADEKANGYASQWYPCDPTYQFNKKDVMHIFDAGTIYVAVTCLRQVEKREWMEETYLNSLE